MIMSAVIVSAMFRILTSNTEFRSTCYFLYNKVKQLASYNTYQFLQAETGVSATQTSNRYASSSLPSRSASAVTHSAGRTDNSDFFTKYYSIFSEHVTTFQI